MKPTHRTIVLVAALTIAADVATKVWASARLDGPIDIGGSMSLELSHNPGVAFGAGQSLPSWVLLVFTGTICVAIAAAGWRGTLAPPVAVGLVLGGAVGNLLDRLTGGSVVDMIHLTWWPTFNLADVAICTGAVLLAVWSLLPDRSDPACVHRPEPEPQ